MNPDANSTNRAKHLYVAYADHGTNANDRADIFFMQSQDGGTNWLQTTNAGVTWMTNAIRVNMDGGANDQWMPTIAVRPDGNMLFIGWLDRRGDTNENSLIDMYGRFGTIGTNGAVSLATSDFRITTTAFPPAFAGTDTNNLVEGHYDPVWPPEGVDLNWWYDWFDETMYPTGGAYAHQAGEHNGAFADMTHVYFVWWDNRSGSQATQYSARNQGDIRLARLPWPQQ